MARKSNKANVAVPVARRFGSEVDVSTLTGIARRTLQHDRFFGRTRFPYYKVRGKVLYDLDEVINIIQSRRVDPKNVAA
jgi:hypothetical protein